MAVRLEELHSLRRISLDALLRRDESGEVDQARSLFAGGLPVSASD